MIQITRKKEPKIRMTSMLRRGDKKVVVSIWGRVSALPATTCLPTTTSPTTPNYTPLHPTTSLHYIPIHPTTPHYIALYSVLSLSFISIYRNEIVLDPTYSINVPHFQYSNSYILLHTRSPGMTNFPCHLPGFWTVMTF